MVLVGGWEELQVSSTGVGGSRIESSAGPSS